MHILSSRLGLFHSVQCSVCQQGSCSIVPLKLLREMHIVIPITRRDVLDILHRETFASTEVGGQVPVKKPVTGIA